MKKIIVVLGGAILAAPQVSAQNLADRIANAGQPRVQFSYAARAEVCGNGRSFFSVGGSSFHGSWNDNDRDSCVRGPIRVVLDRAGREVVSISTHAGPAQPAAAGITDLGTVSVRDAVAFLLGLAENSEGRVSRDAILPAALADSVDVTSRLVAIARNQNAARETRRTAISWVGRPLDNRERNVREIATALLAVARDEDDNQSVRQQALRTLARLEHGVGTQPLMELARDAGRSWLAREALGALASSGDPRARQHLRDVVRRAEFPDDVLAAAVKAVGSEFATGEDVKLLRDTYAKMPGDRSREATVSAVATFGGAENVRWLLALARDANQPVSTRRRAVQHAYRGGTPVAEIIKVYDETTDQQVKDAVLAVLVESGDKAATDKLMAIARSDESSSMRRKAISHLSRSSDERVRKFLADMAQR